MPVVCSACQTINRYSATVCKGCAGKLPAFYTAAGAGHTSSASGAVGARAWVVRGARAFTVPARWVTVVWVAVALITLFGAFGLWYAMYSSAAGRAVPAQTSLQAIEAAAAPSLPPSALPAARPTLTADALKSVAPPTGAVVNMPVEAPSSNSRQAVRAPTQARSDLQRRAWSPPAEPRAVSVRHVETGPLAMCRDLPFIARAVCTNNYCAQRPNARHPQCAEPVRQRRLDEARRNPTLLN